MAKTTLSGHINSKYKMWGHVSGLDPRPREDEKKILSWNTKNAKIKTWILGSVEPQCILNLKPYKTSKDVGISETSISPRALCPTISTLS